MNQVVQQEGLPWRGGGTKLFLTSLTRSGGTRHEMARFPTRVCQPDDKGAPSDSPDGKVSIQAVPA